MEHGRRRPRRAGHARDRAARPRAGRARSSRGFVARVPKAYPMYDEDYAERVDVDPRLARRHRRTSQQVGRNGLHRYNNSDHSMLTAMRAVDNILHGTDHDIWAVNVESVYHEEHQEPEQPYKNVPATLGHAAGAERGRLAAREPAARHRAPGRRLGRRARGGRLVGVPSAAARSCRAPAPRCPARRRRSRCTCWPRSCAASAGARSCATAAAHCSRPDAAALTTIGYMGNNALPARAGDLMKAFLTARRTGAPGTDAVGVLVAERMLDAAALGLVFAVLVTTLRLPLGVPGWALALVGGGLLVAGCLALFFGRRTSAGRRASAVVARVLAPSRRLWSRRGAALLALSMALWLVEGGVYAVLGGVAGVHLSAARRPVRHGAREHRRARPRRAGLRRHVRRRGAARRVARRRAPATPRRSPYVVARALRAVRPDHASSGSSRWSRATAAGARSGPRCAGRGATWRRPDTRRPRTLTSARPRPRRRPNGASSPAAAARRPRPARRRGATRRAVRCAARARTARRHRSAGSRSSRLPPMRSASSRPIARPRPKPLSAPAARCRGGSARRCARARRSATPGPRSATSTVACTPW